MKIVLFTLIRCVILFSVFAATGSAQDATGIKTANLKNAKLDLMNNHDPASELANFDLLPGYQVNLFASDPMLANPVHMHWDSRGRLWVACSWAYPQLKPGEVANDKIIILEDTDGDGAADKSTVFADGLYLPTGIELANGGCYVAQSPDVFFLKDTDGDDVADVKELALTGFGIEDSHHSISAWRRGPGGWLYFQEGIFLHTQVETQYGVVRNFNGGVYQFNPRTQELRMFCRGTGGNPWGHVFDRWGQSFMVNNPRIMYLSPASGNSGEAVPVKPLISTEKQCGGDLATGTHVGDDIRGQLLTGRFKSRTVVRYELIEDGAGFSANVLRPLISSKHPNFRPVDVKTGPDGAIYVADWYNSIINHAQHDFRDPRRDHDHGRIWRITHKDRPLVQPPTLVGAPVGQLVEHLSSPEDWVRHQARKELSEKDSDKTLAALEQWVESLDTKATNYDHHLVEAMWACQNAGRVSEKILHLVMNAEDGHARSAGARMIRYWHESLTDPVDLIARASRDPFPRTRMEAVLSAGFIPSLDAFVAALSVLDHPMDATLSTSLPQTTKSLEPYWRPALKAGTLQFARPSHQAYIEQGLGFGLKVRLEELIRQTSPSAEEIALMRTQLLESATDVEIQIILNALTDDKTPPPSTLTIALLETLEQLAAKKWSRKLKRSVRGLNKLLAHEDESVAVLAAKNIGVWQVASGAELKMLQSGEHRAAVQHAIAVSLGVTNVRNRGSLTELTDKGDLKTRYAAAAGLAHADLKQSVDVAAELFAQNPDGGDPVRLLKTILGRRGGGQLLGEALSDVKMHPKVVSQVGEFHRDSGLLSEALVEAFQTQAKSGSLNSELLAEDPDKLASAVDAQGDPSRGETIFRRKEVGCASCHAIGAAGPETGPNLVAVGGAAKTKYMVQSILRPNAAIAEHYETRTFLLASGKIQTGIVAFRSKNEVVIRDAAQLGKEVRIAVDEIDDEIQGKSLMPAGLADQLHSRAEFLDLVKFVSVLGKAGAYTNDESPVIRKWRVAKGMAGRMPDDATEWLPAYSKVDGVLPLEELPQGDTVLAQGFVNVLVDGRVTVATNGDDGLSLWVDGNPAHDLGAAIKMSRGRHTLTFAITPQTRTIGLRVELKAADDVVKFTPEGGQ